MTPSCDFWRRLCATLICLSRSGVVFCDWLVAVKLLLHCRRRGIDLVTARKELQGTDLLHVVLTQLLQGRHPIGSEEAM